MKHIRTKSITTRITEAEYRTFERLAQGRSLSEWARETLQHRAVRRDFEELLVAELFAARTILVSLLFAVCSGAAPSVDEMRQIIERADEDRFRRAQERLSLATLARPR